MKKYIFIFLIIVGIGGFMFFKKDAPKEFSGNILNSAQNDSASFTVRYPDGYKVFSTAPDESQELYSIENSDGNGFQIFVTPFDEAGPITADRIWQDMPDAQINEPGEAKLDGADSFVFYGYNEDIGDTFEVWTVRDEKLYQIMGRKTDEQLIVDTLNTWKWR